MNIPFQEASARLATNVDNVFEEVINLVLDNDGGSNYNSKFTQSNKELPEAPLTSPRKAKENNLTLK